jgi:hypothetical protein
MVMVAHRLRFDGDETFVIVEPGDKIDIFPGTVKSALLDLQIG